MNKKTSDSAKHAKTLPTSSRDAVETAIEMSKTDKLITWEAGAAKIRKRTASWAISEPPPPRQTKRT